MLPLKFLHTVDMTYDFKNPSRVDKEALLKFLEKNNGVHNLDGEPWRDLNDYHPDIKYSLLINHARKGTPLQTTNTTASTTATTTSDDSSILPLVLPWLLERAYKKSNQIFRKPNNKDDYCFLARTKYHDGVYDLLCNSFIEVVIATNAMPEEGRN